MKNLGKLRYKYVELKKWPNIPMEISRINCLYKANIECIEKESTFSWKTEPFSYLFGKRAFQRNGVQREEEACL